MLTTTMSHEHLTPLNSIINISQMMREDFEYGELFTKSERQEFIQVIWSSGKLLQYYVQSRLSQHQIAAKTYNLKMKGIPLAQLKDQIDEVHKPYELQMKDQNLSLNVSVDHDLRLSSPKSLITDWSLYQQCLFNIFGNAVKFNKHNGKINILLSYKVKRILVTDEDEDSDASTISATKYYEEQYLVTTVQDKGYGIASNR